MPVGFVFDVHHRFGTIPRAQKTFCMDLTLYAWCRAFLRAKECVMVGGDVGEKVVLHSFRIVVKGTKETNIEWLKEVCWKTVTTMSFFAEVDKIEGGLRAMPIQNINKRVVSLPAHCLL